MVMVALNEVKGFRKTVLDEGADHRKGQKQGNSPGQCWRQLREAPSGS